MRYILKQARQWDPVKAKVMYLNMASWRKENDIENLYSTFDFPELDSIIPLYPHFYHKARDWIELNGHELHSTAPRTWLRRCWHAPMMQNLHATLLCACHRLTGLGGLCTSSSSESTSAASSWR